MATIVSQGYPNLGNFLTRCGANGEVLPMGEVLNQKLDWLSDIPWVECNLSTGHQMSLRTGLPSAQWRSLNQGVSNTKTNAAVYVETTGMLEDRAEVDVDAPINLADFRLSEERGKIEAMSQAFASAVFYESVFNNADRIHGLSPRYGGTTGFTSSSYVLKGTVGGVNAYSVWLIDWDIDKTFGIYPKGSMAGLKRQDLGELDVLDANGLKFRALATKLQWKCGIAIRDYRQNCRFQWDPDDATNFADTTKGMYLGLQNMLCTVQNLGPNARFYMNKYSYMKLVAQLASNSADFLKYVDMGGRMIPAFLGVPIRLTEALVAETAIS